MSEKDKMKILDDVLNRHSVMSDAPNNEVAVNTRNAISAIAELADKAGSSYAAEVKARAEVIAVGATASEEALIMIGKLSEVIEVAGTQRNAAIESLRLSRMTITSEVTQIEQALKKLSLLDIEKTARNLKEIASLMENPNIRRLVGMNDKAG